MRHRWPPWGRLLQKHSSSSPLQATQLHPVTGRWEGKKCSLLPQMIIISLSGMVGTDQITSYTWRVYFYFMAQWLHAGTLKTEARFGVYFCWANLGKFHMSIGLSFPRCKMGVSHNSQNCYKEKIHVNTSYNVTYIGIVQQMGESSYMWKSLQTQVLLEVAFFLFLFFSFSIIKADISQDC